MITNTKLSSNFLKLLLTVVFCLALFSCDNQPPSSSDFPIVVVSKAIDKTDDFYDCITIKTKEGEYKTYSTGNNGFARTIIETYKVGDTIK